jgi:UDP-N-acetylmuramoyl-L-alanyl-D-glutamate--2,6-diaminopimelate ligase
VTTTSASAGSGADVRPRELEIDLDGIRGELVTPAGPIQLRSSLVGRFNVCNIAVAVGMALALGVDPAAIAAGLRALRRVPGRLEPVAVAQGGTGPRVLVDYAHTPDALGSVLAALRPLVPGQIWTVFGCGGDRDQGKRPLMGQVAAEGSDQLVVTSDNPRGEDPQAIIDQILVGVAPVGTPHRTEVDRRAAIGAALAAAGSQDLVLIAGKGHEQVQVIGDRSRPFDDREVAREALLAGEAR